MNGRDQNCTMIYTKEVMNPYIQPFNGNIDAVETEAWLDQLETYFNIHAYMTKEKVTFARLKLFWHVVV